MIFFCYVYFSFLYFFFFFLKKKTAYEMRISDWSSDVCSSDLGDRLQGRSAQVDIDGPREPKIARVGEIDAGAVATIEAAGDEAIVDRKPIVGRIGVRVRAGERREAARARATGAAKADRTKHWARKADTGVVERSEEHTSELQSLMRISYAVFCLKKK